MNIASRLTVFLVALGTARLSPGQPSRLVGALAQDARVRSALEAAKESEPQTIGDQIRFCEVPAPPFNEKARGELLRQAFTQLGLRDVRVDRVGNVIGDRPGDAPSPRLVVAAHLDTVFPEGTDVRVAREGSTLKGPGIGDNCRGLAVLVAVGRSMKQAGIQTPGSVTFVANVGEEGLGDLRGVRALFGETLKGRVDRFVSIDNTGIHVSTVAVGSRRYRITFKGPGGHSYVQFGTANPANALGRAVAKVAEFRVPGDPRTTFNVGRIGGGTSVNAIPSEAWMEVDLRSSDGRQLSLLDGRLRQAVAAAAREENARWGSPGVVTATTVVVGDRPAASIPHDAPIVETALAVAMAVGTTAFFSESSSDSNLPLSLGIPAITIGGGGRSTNSHALDESFDLTDAWRGAQNALLLTIALAR